MISRTHAIERLFAAAGQLPSIPRVVQKMIETLRDEDADLLPLIGEIRTDPTISARVLKLANSGYYGSRRAVGSIDEAVSLIGTRAMRTLVISAGVSGSFPKVPGVDLQSFWRHALLTASITSQLARRAGENAERAYSAGLMLRVGQLMIHIAFPRVADEILRECQGLGMSERATVEQHKLNTNHCEVGAELAMRWNFPDDIAAALEYYCQPRNPDASLLARLAHVAAQCAFELEQQTAPEDIVQRLDNTVTDMCGLDPAGILQDIRSCAERAAGDHQAD